MQFPVFSSQFQLPVKEKAVRLDRHKEAGGGELKWKAMQVAVPHSRKAQKGQVDISGRGLLHFKWPLLLPGQLHSQNQNPPDALVNLQNTSKILINHTFEGI